MTAAFSKCFISLGACDSSEISSAWDVQSSGVFSHEHIVHEPRHEQTRAAIIAMESTSLSPYSARYSLI